ncbi:Probable E3 ubiquitin-protein ligase sinah [Gryllus bimaculatus]|nr:Probable E3 ubiquitin-protein ligase sinah [Gryllus bimaculatus]
MEYYNRFASGECRLSRRGRGGGVASPPKDSEEASLARIPAARALETLRGMYRALRCPLAGLPVPARGAVRRGRTRCASSAAWTAPRPRVGCGRALLAARNAALEDVARAALLPCAHRAAGCDVVLPPGDAKPHALACPRRPLICPKLDPMCHWKGPMQSLSEHVKLQHPLHIGRGSELELMLGGRQGIRDNFGVLLCCGDRFLARVRVRTARREVLAAVLYLGDRRPAADFAYDACLDLADGDGGDAQGRRVRRRVAQRLPVHDIGRDLERVLDAGDCFRAPLEEFGVSTVAELHRVRIRIEENA